MDSIYKVDAVINGKAVQTALKLIPIVSLGEDERGINKVLVL